MDGCSPQDEIEQVPAEDRELDTIINTLTFGSRNGLNELNNVTRNLIAICRRASGRLTDYTSTHGQYVSKREVDRVLAGMEPAVEKLMHARTEIIPLLQMAECAMRQSLLPTPACRQTVQRVISAGRESVLWRRVACRRVGVAPPPGHPSLKDVSLTVAGNMFYAARKWHEATKHLKADIKDAVNLLTESLQSLAQVRYRTGHVTNSAMQEVHHIFTVLHDVVVEINYTLLFNFEKTFKDLEYIRSSLLEESNSWPA